VTGYTPVALTQSPNANWTSLHSGTSMLVMLHTSGALPTQLTNARNWDTQLGNDNPVLAHDDTQSAVVAPGHSLCRRVHAVEHSDSTETSGCGSGSLPPVVGSDPVTGDGSVPNGGNGRVTGMPMLSPSEQPDAHSPSASAASAQMTSRGFTCYP
jgi:hypothetical protein